MSTYYPVSKPVGGGAQSVCILYLVDIIGGGMFILCPINNLGRGSCTRYSCQ